MESGADQVRAAPSFPQNYSIMSKMANIGM